MVTKADIGKTERRRKTVNEDQCPKPECGRPKSTSRRAAGRELSICGNGHSWDPIEIREKNRKAEEANREEFTDLYGGFPLRIAGSSIR
jgi:hypothetical protein